MPTEIALLPMVESAFNPVAMSTSRASGIWQFIPSTGKHYGLNQDFWMDSRRDVLAGTDKALTYLLKLHGDFDDWQLALAGYNWGEGNVAKAVAQQQGEGAADRLPEPGHAGRDGQLPAEAAGDQEHRPRPGEVRAGAGRHPRRAVLRRGQDHRKMDTKFAAELAEMSLEDFLALNPQHNRPVIAGADEQTILLPIDNAEIFAAKLELTNQPMVSWQAYRMRPTRRCRRSRRNTGCRWRRCARSTASARKAKVPAGHTLLVPSQSASTEAVASLSQAVFTTVPVGPHVLLHGEAGRPARRSSRPGMASRRRN